MIWLTILALMPVQNADSADAIFQKMEQACFAAKTLKTDVQLTVTKRGSTTKIAGTAAFAPMSRYFLDLTSDGKKSLTVCDGKRFKEDTFPVVEIDKNDDLNATFRFMLTRTGFIAFHFLGESVGPGKKPSEPPFRADSDLKVSNVKLVNQEKIGEHDAQVLSYTLRVKREQFRVSVWINPTTGLPLKRVLVHEGMEFEIVEIYVPVANIDIADKEFDVPK